MCGLVTGIYNTERKIYVLCFERIGSPNQQRPLQTQKQNTKFNSTQPPYLIIRTPKAACERSFFWSSRSGMDATLNSVSTSRDVAHSCNQRTTCRTRSTHCADGVYKNRLKTILEDSNHHDHCPVYFVDCWIKNTHSSRSFHDGDIFNNQTVWCTM